MEKLKHTSSENSGKVTIKKSKSSHDRFAKPSKTSRIGLRISSRQERIIRLASEIREQSLTDFILDTAYKTAEETLLEQRLFMVSKEKYKKFSELLDRPAQDNKGLKELFSKSSPWNE